MIREPAVSGTFYPSSPGELQSQILNYMPEVKEKKQVKGVIAPHAGYVYSGPVAAMTYARIKPSDTYIILGPNHYGIGGDFEIMLEGIWRTPLGEAVVDDLLAEKIYKNSGLLSANPKAQSREHSIEVQLPFLQVLRDKPYFVPISVKHYPPTREFHELCVKIADLLAN